MKKILCVCLSVIIVAFTCGLLVGCNDNDYDKFKLNIDLDNYTVNITDATGLGVVNIDNKLKLVKTTAPSQNGIVASNVGSSNEVDYDEVEYTDESGNIFDVDSTDTEVYQMYVTKEFTFVSYISVNVRKYGKYTTPTSLGDISIDRLLVELGDGDFEVFYDTTKLVPFDHNLGHYKNNQFVKTYIIHNSTGKMYDTQFFTDIDSSFYIKNDLIRVGEIFYDYFVNQNNELIIKKIVDNSDIQVNEVLKDANGYLYVSNRSINRFDSENNTLYTTKNIVMGSDGYVYEDEPSSSLYRLDGDARVLVDDFSQNISFDGNNIKKLENGILFTAFNYSYVCITLYDMENDASRLDAFNLLGYDFDASVLFKIDNGNLYIYKDYNFKDNYLGDAELLAENCEYVYNYDYVENGVANRIGTFRVTEPSQTTYYNLCNNGTEIYLEELANTQYDSSIIVIQPIN